MLLGLGTVLLEVTDRLGGYALPHARISLDTAIAVIAAIVAVLTAVRFLVEGRGMDALLAAGFFAFGLGTLIFAVGAAFTGETRSATNGWAGIGTG